MIADDPADQLRVVRLLVEVELRAQVLVDVVREGGEL
jgi:hypothetical protein